MEQFMWSSVGAYGSKALFLGCLTFGEARNTSGGIRFRLWPFGGPRLPWKARAHEPFQRQNAGRLSPKLYHVESRAECASWDWLRGFNFAF